MKILLISIDLVLGTRILVNVLKSKGIKSHMLQITGIKYSDFFSKKKLKDIYGFSKKYDAVGLAFNSFYPILAAQLGRYLKSKGVKWIIAGGPHATAMPEETMGYSDISIIYEAELTLPKVLKNLGSDSSSFQKINGIAFKDKNGRIVNTGCPRIETNLDNIPFQSFSSKDITYYNFRNGKFDRPTINNLFPHGGKNYFILTSRGCPFKCTYCCNNLFAKLSADFNKIRKRSVRNIISEMKLAKKSGFKGFYIVDDNFLAFTLRELKKFAKLYSNEINLPFGISGLNPNNMRTKDSDKKIGLLLSCGLSDIRIGVQSGSDKTLKMFQRRYTAEELPKLLSTFEKRKTIWKEPNDRLRVAIDLICDAPWENEKNKLETIRLANNLLSTYSIFFYTLIYLPKTDIYELALKTGWLKDKEKNIYLRGIAGVEDNIYNRLLFLIAVLKERGSRLPDEITSHILKIQKMDPDLSKVLVNSIIKFVNDIEEHHNIKTSHLTLHPYLKGFNEWEKTVGQKGKKVLFRSYHEPYG